MHLLSRYGGVPSNFLCSECFLLCAGGIGITSIAPMIRDILNRYSQGSLALENIVFIWAVRSSEDFKVGEDILRSLAARGDFCKTLLYVTGDNDVESDNAPSDMVPFAKLNYHRPNFSSLVNEVTEQWS
jgi:ferredoxin-NADP reductase